MNRFTCFRNWTKAGLVGASALALSACNSIDLPFGQTAASSASSPDLTRPAAVAQTDAQGLEVEAPDVFYLEETGLWDGRPSLGGVWVAHPDVGDPERVLVTNQSNGETVIGALFRRERDNPGPEIMVSSDAAAALNVIAGQPTEFTVVALRPQEIPEVLDLAVEPPEPEEIAIEAEPALPATIAATTLDSAESAAEAAAPALDVATLAENAIAVSAAPAPAPVATLEEAAILADTAAIAAPIPAAVLADRAPEAEPAPRPIETAALATEALPAPEATTAPAEPAAEEVAAVEEPALPEREDLTRPYIQIGVFSAEANAETAAADMRSGGVIPTVLDQSNEDRALWRVIVGPVRNSADRAALLETIQGLGYEDAYFVTN